MGNVQTMLKKVNMMRYDVKINRWLGYNQKPNSQVFIVDINSQDLDQNDDLTWSYHLISQLIKKLREYKVSVIASDLLFTRSKSNIVDIIGERIKQLEYSSDLESALLKVKPDFSYTENLIKQIKDQDDIVLSYVLNRSEDHVGILPEPILVLDNNDNTKLPIENMSGYVTNFKELDLVSKYNGYNSILIDLDGTIRNYPLVLRYGNKVYPSLALSTLEAFTRQNNMRLNMTKNASHLKSVQVGNKKIFTDSDGQIWIPYNKRKSRFKTVSAFDIVNDRLSSKDVADLKGAVVFIGTNEQSMSELITYNRKLSNVEVQATAFDAISQDMYMYTPYWGIYISTGMVMFVGILLTIIVASFSTGLYILIALAMQLSIMSINMLLFFKFNIVLALSTSLALGAALVLINSLCGFLFESRKKTFIRKYFAQYVPPAYLDLLLKDPSTYGLEGKSEELTVLFADIRHFTTISESLDASGVKKLLNQFLTPMTKIILKNNGTIDKYVGDMVMAFWGAPIENQQHVEEALGTALDMLSETSSLKKKFRAQRLPAVDIGIGMNTGLMNVGDMGSEYRRSYTVIGDAVNLGSRLQAATSYYHVKLLVGPKTIENQTNFVYRQVDRVKFKGKNEAVDVYEVICRKSEAKPALARELKLHEKALDAYFAKDWVLAEQLFKDLFKSYPNTLMYKVFVARIGGFIGSPPPDDWDCTYVFTEK
ncbi:MAG: adenylate/guanylate cyclase domain-containing protein [Legionellaceae bacterium]|nr:adenylate/guanylate cyclase domain-containing protein [Legionellaceae bacterium]